MHRHSYLGRKLQRAKGPRKALFKAQLTSLVLHEQIETTEAKAKEVSRLFERLVTKAKRGDLNARRALQGALATENAVRKLMQELAPAFQERQGGYTRVVKTAPRRGDNAPMAVVSLVLPEDFEGAGEVAAKEEKPEADAKGKSEDKEDKKATGKKAADKPKKNAASKAKTGSKKKQPAKKGKGDK